jgi:hypothetical protein
VSTYPFWLLTFDVRDDLEEHVLDVLQAVAEGTEPDPAHLERLPADVRSCLQEPRRLLDDQVGPAAGTPVRMARNSFSGRWTITVELCLHDDAFADRGWLFYLWILDLAHRPHLREGRTVIGHHGPHRGDPASVLVWIDAEGVTEGDLTWPFTEIEAALRGEKE